MTVLWAAIALTGTIFVAATFPGVYREHRRYQRALRMHLAILDFAKAIQGVEDAVNESMKQLTFFAALFKEASRVEPRA